VSEADANEADVVEQQQPAVPGDADGTELGGGEPLPLEAEVGDVLEQGHALPDDGDDEPRPTGEDDRA
jgi:hypothetical protein